MQAMQEQLKARKEDMDSIERLGQSLIDLSKESAGCQHSVRHSLSAVWQQWEHLQHQTMQLENLLTDMLGQWARYHTDLHSLSQVLGQIEYTLNRYSLLGADIKALSNQVEKLKVIFSYYLILNFSSEVIKLCAFKFIVLYKCVWL